MRSRPRFAMKADDFYAGFGRCAHVLVAEVQPVRQPVHLERDACLERDLEGALEVERVRRPVADQAAGRMAEAPDRRVAHRLGHSRR